MCDKYPSDCVGNENEPLADKLASVALTSSNGKLTLMMRGGVVERLIIRRVR